MLAGEAWADHHHQVACMVTRLYRLWIGRAEVISTQEKNNKNPQNAVLKWFKIQTYVALCEKVMPPPTLKHNLTQFYQPGKAHKAKTSLKENVCLRPPADTNSGSAAGQ